jgi:ammonium transporter Rh
MRYSLAFFLFLVEIAIIIIYATACEFDLTAEEFTKYYAVFQDVHVMIFVGFGFLMVFMRFYSWSSVGYTYITAAFATQLVPLWIGMWESIFKGHAEKMHINIHILIRAEFGAAAVLITMGGLLGKVTEGQLCVIAIIETFFYTLNETISLESIPISDIGGSMVIHLFGATFGLALTKVFSDRRSGKSHNVQEAYHSNLIAMVGTMFLYMFWPSFNAALALDE